METEHVNLADWLRAEMRTRGFTSGRQIAEWLGLSHNLINGILSNQQRPSLPTLAVMAEKTGANLFVLVALAYPEHKPDLARLTTASPGVLFRAQLIEELPEPVRDIIDGILLDRTGKRDRTDKSGS